MVESTIGIRTIGIKNNSESSELRWRKKTRDESGFLEAPLVRQADGELKNHRFVDSEFVKSCHKHVKGGPRVS